MNNKIFQIIRQGSLGELKEALLGASIQMVNEYNQNLLHEAIAHGKTEMGEFLISSGIEVNHCDRDMLTPLHYAAAHKNITIAEKVLNAGGKLDISDIHGNQPLWTAVFNARGCYDIVQLFINNNADSLHKNKHGKSPLDFAKQIKEESLVLVLTSKK